MRALAVRTARRGLFPTEIDEPAVRRGTDVKLRVLEVGICGTDREEISTGNFQPPEGSDFLVIGHEMLGEVVETGPAVAAVRPGDLAVFTVRRGCGSCVPCLAGRYDMCRTGMYRERGIVKLHGYQCEYVVDDEDNIVPVPPSLREVGVLLEPLSVIEKGLDEAVLMQRTRLGRAGSSSWLFGKKCLVAGIGPVGLLAAMALRLRGAEVTGMDIVPAGSPRPRLLAAFGGSYVDTSQVPPHELRQVLGREADLVVEATGVPQVALHLPEALAPGGGLVAIGIPEKEEVIAIPAGSIVRRLVLNNQLIVGSVNASREHFRMAAADLAAGLNHWNGPLRSLITHRFKPEEMPQRVLAHTPDKIKAVVEWGPQPGGGEPTGQSPA